MVEVISYSNSPFDEYLKETGRIEEELTVDEETYHDAELIEESREQEEVTRIEELKQQEQEIILPSSKNNKKDQFSERLGYALVTSSLLTPSINEALVLYPTPIRKSLTSPISTSNLILSTPPITPAPLSKVLSQQPSLDWGKNWETRGQLFTINSILNIFIVIYIFLKSATTSIKSTTTSSTKFSPINITGQPIDKSKPFSTHDLILETIDSLILVTQEVDLKIARALVGIKEVEGVGIDNGLFDTELSQSQNRRRPASISIAPPSLRSLPLREYISSSLSTLNTKVISSLALIRPPPVTLITPQTSPNLISSARLSSPIHFGSNPSNNTSTTSHSTTLSAPTTQDLDYYIDLSASTSSNRNSLDGNHSFGGVDRSSLSSPTRRLPPSPNSRTIWENSPPSPISPNSSNIPGLPQKRRRPSSLHIWSVPPSNGSNSHNLPNPAGGTLGRSGSLKRYSSTSKISNSNSNGEENLTTLFRSNSTRERTSISSRSNTPRRLSSSFESGTLFSSSTSTSNTSTLVSPIDQSPTSIDSLQSSFESMHSNRIQLLWRLINLTDKSVQPIVLDSEWLSIRLILEDLVKSLKEVSLGISKAVENQFGKDNIGTETFLINNGRSSRLSMLSESEFSSPLPPIPPTSSSSTTTSTSQYPSLFLALSTNLNTPSISSSRANSIPSSPTPKSVSPKLTELPISFAPLNPNSIQTPLLALNQFEQQTLKMSLTLRLLATKLSVVNEEISRRRLSNDLIMNTSVEVDEAGEEIEEQEEELVILHDSLKGELIRLSREWEESRISLRQFVKKPTKLKNGGLFKLTESSSSYKEPVKEEESIVVDSKEDAEGSKVLYSEGPLGESNFELETRQALQDVTNSSYLPPSLFGTNEQIYESTSPPSPSPTSLPNSPSNPFSLNSSTNSNRTTSTMTREERIKSVKAERRKGSVLISRSGSTGSLGMVEELKDVLELLKGRNKLPVDAV